MKLYAVISVILLLTMLFVPLFSLLGDAAAQKTMSYAQQISAEEATSAHTESKEEDEDVKTESKDNAAEEKESKDSIRVQRTASGKVENVDMRSYIIGCVASEMLPTYEKEALKAQAIVSYTYALYLLQNPYSSEADITDSPSSHQTYRSLDEIKEKWGSDYGECIKRIEEAVTEAEGKYLTYNGEIIKPAYHAMSPGRTNSALDVWGSDVPYLQSVTSDGDRLSPKLISTYEFTESEMKKALAGCGGDKIGDISIGEAVTNSGGYVKSIDISGVTFSGEKLRTAFSLRSGSFTLEKNGDNYKFTCTGYGHGVGMSQNGAQFMAKNGATCEEILKHYYTGIEIKS